MNKDKIIRIGRLAYIDYKIIRELGYEDVDMGYPVTFKDKKGFWEGKWIMWRFYSVKNISLYRIERLEAEIKKLRIK